MAAFTYADVKEDFKTYNLFRHGAITLFHDLAVLEETIAYLRERQYIVHEFDCPTYQSEGAFHHDILLRLGILNEPFKPLRQLRSGAFWDLLSSADVPDESGLILVFKHFDVLEQRFPDGALHVLEDVAYYNYRKLWFGKRFKAFVQTENDELQNHLLGARRIMLNNEETRIRFKKNREQRERERAASNTLPQDSEIL